jgi:hypothetical protein
MRCFSMRQKCSCYWRRMQRMYYMYLVWQPSTLNMHPCMQPSEAVGASNTPLGMQTCKS